MVTLAAILNVAFFWTYFCTLRLRVAFYHMHFFSLCLSNYLNIIFKKRRPANDFQDGEKYKLAATFHILSCKEPIVKYFNKYASLANGLVQFTFVNLC